MVDWARAHEEALEHFRSLLRIDTTNPPGNEAPAAAALSRILTAEGIPHEVVEPRPGRASLVARLSAIRPDPAVPEPDALLLSAHLDVVAADPWRWRWPPFAAEIHDGFIWGRGAIDMKHMAIYGLMTLLLLRRLGLPLRRDVVFAAVADEEAGSSLGAGWIVKNRPDLLRGCRFALNEMGGFTLHIQKKRIYTIQVAERGVCWMTLRARGETGHGSLPPLRNPVTPLARALDRLAARELPYRRSAPVERFIRDLAQTLGGGAGLVLRGLLHPSTAHACLRLIRERGAARVLHASLHNTVNATVLRAGEKINVIPTRAEADLDGRLLPGCSLEEFLEEVHGVAGHEVEVELRRSTRPVETSPDTELFRHLAAVVERRDPGSRALPNLTVGATDASAYAELEIATYGFAPIQLPGGLDFASLYHGDDERIPVEGFRWGLETFFEAVSEWVGSP